MFVVRQQKQTITRLQAERVKRGLSLRALGALARVHYQDIWRIETAGMHPYPSHRARLALALEIDPGELTQVVRVKRREKQ